MSPAGLAFGKPEDRLRAAVASLRSFSELTKLSLAASLFRLVETGHYDDSAVAKWKAFIRLNGTPDFAGRGGGRRQEEWKYKLRKYGTKFADIYSDLIKRGDMDDYEFYRLSGTKPKYQQDYLLNAPGASIRDAQDDIDG